MEHIDRKLLPKEYGGEIPMADMIGRTQFNFNEKTNFTFILFYFIFSAFQLFGKKSCEL